MGMLETKYKELKPPKPPLRLAIQNMIRDLKKVWDELKED